MNFKKALSVIIAFCMLLSLCQFTFAATETYELRDDAVFIGYKNGVAQYVEIGDDMNGLVGASSKDDNPVPATAKYINGLYVQGAQVRIDSQAPTGLRFVVVNNTNMTTLLKNAGVTNITYGALVAFNTNETLTEENSTKVPAKNIFKTAAELNTDYQKFTACITNIPVDSIRLDLSVRPFMKYTDIEGKSHTLYGEQYKCDIYDAAVTAYKSGKENATTTKALYDQIVSKGLDKNGNMPLGNEFELTNDVETQWRDLTDDKINEIKNTPNIEIPAGATVYYVSPNGSDFFWNNGKSPEKAWKTINKVNEASLKAGDYVLFERGGVWREQLKAKAGVTYSAYGTGDKPVITTSPANGATSSSWTSMGNNVWRYNTKMTSDVGSMVFKDSQGNEYYATKWIILQESEGLFKEFKSKVVCPSTNSYTALNQDLAFWHNNIYGTGYSGDDYVYLYSTSNPAQRFTSIEFLINKIAIVTDANNITVDNIAVKYVGAHGIRGGGIIKGLTVTNCTLEWIGGSLQWTNTSSYPHKIARYGNGVEIYGGCTDFTVENCYFDQIYDAAMTHQIGMESSTETKDTGHYNVLFKGNVMQHCTYSIEYFWKHYTGANKPADNPSYLGNILYEDNLMWYCGEGLGSQRPDNTQPAHIKGWTHKNYVNGFVVRNNLMAYSDSMFMHSNFNNYRVVTDDIWTRDGVTVYGNTFIGEYGQNFGAFGYNSANKEFLTYTYDMQTSTKLYRDLPKEYIYGNEFYFVLK